MNDFKLWLEFEEVDLGNWETKNNFCNIHVVINDGRMYGINVWTYDFFKTSIQSDKTLGNNLNGLYLIPPDLFVDELTRDCIEKTIRDLLSIGNLEDVLNPSIISSNTLD